MSLQISRLCLAIGLVVSLHESVGSEPSDPPSAALINKLILQLGSTRFAEREAGRKQLEAIGEPALDFLRTAAKTSKDLETRRRVEQLAEHIESAALDKLVKDGVQYHQKKEYTKAAERFDQAIAKGLKKFRPADERPSGDVPFLTEAYLHSARTSKELGDYEKAAKAYHGATYNANYNREKRQQIDKEWGELAAHLIAGWKDTVKTKTDKDPALTALVAKYPLVLLHSRRYANGYYLQSAYSFLYETTVPRKHYNDVQLLFDNGLRNTFDINMVTNQRNRVVGLGVVNFEKNPDIATIGADKKMPWQSDICKVVEGHTYLENVKDEEGNNFFVLIQVIAIDKESRFVAFVWRRLPGGKIVRRQDR